MSSQALNQLNQPQAIRRGRLLEYVAIGWNLLEAAVAVGAGIFAGSTSLVGFGIDSLIESSSAVALLWRLQDGKRGENREKLTLKLVGFSFLILAIYLSVDSVKSLLTREKPEVTYTGIGLAILSLIVMPLLARAKRSVAIKLNSRAMKADSRQNDICAYLSLILLIGLSLNALFGWWWADSVAALVMIPIIVKEGLEALRGETCSDCHG